MGRELDDDHARARRVPRGAARVLRRRPRRRARAATSTCRRRASTRSGCSTTHTVAYLDLTAAASRPIAHLRENGRITLMFCAFEGRPQIVRLHGRGTVIPRDAPGRRRRSWSAFPDAARRALGDRRVDVDARLDRRAGYGVPLMDLVGERYAAHGVGREARGDDGLEEYRAEKNATSINGLPGMAADRRELADPSGARACARWRSSASTRCCSRSAPTCRTSPATRRCRSSGSRCSCSRATAKRCSSCPSSRRPGSSRGRSVFGSSRGARPTTRSRSSPGSSAPAAGASRSATRHGPASCSACRTRSRRARSAGRPTVIGPLRMRQGRRRGRRAARGRARGRRGREPRCAAVPFGGRTELDVHRELVDRMLEHGHQRVELRDRRKRARTARARTTKRASG